VAPDSSSPEAAQAAPEAVGPAGVAPAVAPREGTPRAVRTHRRVKVAHRARRAKRQVAKARVVVAPAPRARVVAPVAAAPRATPAARRIVVTGAAGSRPARPGSRTHVVAVGESLWSIAADHLGANASSAQIGREVERLWAANRARIGTGDRDLLMAGTRLVLG
jgi:hypothetical protein